MPLIPRSPDLFRSLSSKGVAVSFSNYILDTSVSLFCLFSKANLVSIPNIGELFIQFFILNYLC